MESYIDRPANLEIDFGRRLREEVSELLRTQRLSVEGLAETLRLMPSGVEVLLRKVTWSPSVAFRVAEALDIPVEVRVDHPTYG